ncbi:MAG: DUF2239 family protein [Verrucomicrobia bacterium]|jgi:uncharacterized protein|nr:DUF2239 family protein [Verrucomicrobiota bacterium]MDA7510164.1 DUF2239 family protein [Verrucomicrobiota bacterium]
MNRIPAGDEHTITPSLCVAFSGTMRVASGKIDHVAAKSKQLMDREPSATVLVFDSSTAHQVEIDFRGSVSDVRNRAKRQALTESGTTSQDDPSLKPQTSRGPGRPKLGVIAREVTLLPRHWAWLKSQPGGASVTLRKLVEKARRTSAGQDDRREAQDAAYRFTSVMAGDLPGFEEATRALFSGSREEFESQTQSWPKDIRVESLRFGNAAF